MGWSALYPRVTERQIEDFRRAIAKIDQLGHSLGKLNNLAVPMWLDSLGDIAMTFARVIETTEQRLYRARKKRGLLTAEEITAEQIGIPIPEQFQSAAEEE